MIRRNTVFDQFIRRAALACLLVLATSALVAQAQTFSTPKNISNDTGDSVLPLVAVDSSGNINVVWLDNTPGNFAVFFSRSSDGGATFSSPKNIGSNNSSNTGVGQQNIAVDSSGNINVVWHAFVGTLGNADIFFSRSSDGGVTFSTPKDTSNNLSFSTAQQIALDSSGNINLVWHGEAFGSSILDIFFSRSSDGGATFSTPKNLSNNVGFCSSCSRLPQIAVDSSGNINLVWEGLAGVGNIDIFFRRSTDGGVTFSTPKNLSNNAGTSQGAQIAVDSSGNINVVWEDNAPGQYDIFLSRSSDGGATFSTPRNLSTNTGTSFNPHIAVDSSGNINVVWEDNTPGLLDVFFSRSSDGGTTFSTPRNLSNNNTATSLHPEIAVDSSGNINVVWEDNAPGQYDIFISRSTDGGATFSTPKNVSSNTGWSLEPQIALDPRGNINVVWEDNTPGNYDIFFASGILCSDSSRYNKLSPVNGRFGQFCYRDLEGRDDIEIDPEWLAANIVTASLLPTCGPQQMHREARDAFLQAFAIIDADPVLRDQVLQCNGLFVPRYQREAPHEPQCLSNHSWGSAIDLNYFNTETECKNVPPYEVCWMTGLPGDGQPSPENQMLWDQAFGTLGFFQWGYFFDKGREDPMHFEVDAGTLAPVCVLAPSR